MAEIKSEKKKPGQKNRERRGFGENSLLIGIGMGTILLVLAEIFCILGEIYYMVSNTRSSIVIIISTLLLLVTTGVFLYIMENALMKKMEEQRQADERLLRMNKVAYGKMEERDEKLYKRQLSVAKAQIKRTRESVMNMVRANEYIIDVIDEKLGKDSVLSSYGAALHEVQESVAQLRELCERIAEGQGKEPVPEILAESGEEMPEMTEEAPEPEEEIPEMTEEAPEVTEEFSEQEEPGGVEIEPLPEEVLKHIDEFEMEAMPDELVLEAETELEEFLPESVELDELPESETVERKELPEMEEPEIEELPEMEGPEIEEFPEMEEPEAEEAFPEEENDTGQPMSMEDIAALFNNL